MDPRSPIDVVREAYPAAFCRPCSVLESFPPRVGTWRVLDGYDDQPIGPEVGSEEQAWILAAESVVERAARG